MIIRSDIVNGVEYNLHNEALVDLPDYFEKICRKHLRIYGVVITDRYDRPIDNETLLDLIHRQELYYYKRRTPVLNRLPKKYINFLNEKYEKNSL